MENKIFKPGPAPEDKGEQYKHKFPYDGTLNLDKIKLRESIEPNNLEIENLDKYETEKITTCLRDVQMLADTMSRYLSKMKELDNKGTLVQGNIDFATLRYPNALFGPDGEFEKFQKLSLNMALILDRINTLEKKG
jgi:hypothetical protein